MLQANAYQAAVLNGVRAPSPSLTAMRDVHGVHIS